MHGSPSTSRIFAVADLANKLWLVKRSSSVSTQQYGALKVQGVSEDVRTMDVLPDAVEAEDL
jgi:hypothetical protein